MSAPYRIIGRYERSVEPVAKKEDEYVVRLVKLIPGDVLAGYIAGSSVIPKEKPLVIAIWAVVCLVAVVVTRYRGTFEKHKKQSPQLPVVMLSAIEFVILVYTEGGPFVAYGLHEPYLGPLLSIAFAFFAPYIYHPRGK
ncbi:MAG: hypothetical protein ACRER2_10990 [Methylococcales bacterium]